VANLVGSWIPALDGVEDKLAGGAHVADVGCGHGASTVLMAQAWPGATLVGFDYHADSIDQARKRAAEAGVADRCRFEVASAKDYPAGGYDVAGPAAGQHRPDSGRDQRGQHRRAGAGVELGQLGPVRLAQQVVEPGKGGHAEDRHPPQRPRHHARPPPVPPSPAGRGHCRSRQVRTTRSVSKGIRFSGGPSAALRLPSVILRLMSARIRRASASERAS
jgi:hypothetical protein